VPRYSWACSKNERTHPNENDYMSSVTTTLGVRNVNTNEKLYANIHELRSLTLLTEGLRK
jgi:hypothetical protein